MTLQKNTIQKIIAVVFGLAAFAVLLTLNIQRVRGALSVDDPAISNQFRAANLLATTSLSTAGVLLTSVDATSTNATSTNMTAYQDSNGNIFDGSFNGRGLKHLDAYLTRGGAFGASALGTSTFAIQGFDGVNWQYVNRMLTATTSPTAAFGAGTGVFASDPTLGAVISIGDSNGATVDATTTLHFIVDVTTLNYQKYRCVVTRTTDGSNSCQLTGTF